MPLASKVYSHLFLKQESGPEDGLVTTRLGLSLWSATSCIRLTDAKLRLLRWTYYLFQRKLPTWLPPSFSLKNLLENSPAGWIWSSQEIHT